MFEHPAESRQLATYMQQAIPGAECMQAIFAQTCLLQTTSVDDILLNFPEHGVHLIFESSSQKLRLIEVYDLSRLQVRLLSHSFCHSLTCSLLHLQLACSLLHLQLACSLT